MRRWGATFNPGKTFGSYINPVRKAAILLGRDDAWLTPEIRLIAKRIRNAQDKSFAFPNSIMTPDVMRIILDQGRQSTVGMVAYLSYLSALRDTSETLQLAIANHNEKLMKFTPHAPKATIGPRTYHDNTALVVKFRFRKNVRGGCILIRPCLCAMESPPSRTFCPVRGFWATNRSLLTPGGPSVSKHFRQQQLQPTTKKSHARPQLRGRTQLLPPFLPHGSYTRDHQLRIRILAHTKIGNMDLRRLQMLS